jgi:Zn-finger nucleic acid-binding protein
MPEGTTHCEYCGSNSDVDLQGVSDYTVEEPAEDRICPVCNIAMQTLNLEKDGIFLIERCEQCMGLFFDPNELETLLERSVANVHSIDYSRLDQINRKQRLRGIDKKTRWVKCPVCRQFMNRKSFGVRSGVVIDSCRNHGIWLEGAEFRRLLEWKKAGGSILQQKRQQLYQQEQQKLQNFKSRLNEQGKSDNSTMFNLSRSRHRHEPSILEDVSDAVSLVRKLFD